MWLLYLPGPFSKSLAFAAFLAGILTDYLDGRLARASGQITVLGQLLDPIADKVLVFAAFLAFVEMKILPAWMVMVMLAREVLVTGFRFLGASRGVALAASRGGKHKTALQALSICVVLAFLVARETAFWRPEWTARSLGAIRWGMLVVIFLTLASGVSYTIKNWKKVNGPVG